MTSAMILAAGMGTRLAPLTDFRPKALMPLGDRPILAHLAEKMRAVGIARIVANAHHRADDIEAFVSRKLPGVAVSRERDLLGTAGGVAHARSLLGEGDVLIWNGDIVVDLDPLALISNHEKSGNAATLVVRAAARGKGNVGIDANGRVVRMRKETARAGEIEDVDFLGVHVLGAELREALPEMGCLVGDLYLPALHRGARVGVMRIEKPFHDIGTPAAYLDANIAWLRSSGRRVWSGEGARIADGVDTDDALVGDDATVSGQGKLERVVVWPNACAEAPLESAIVTPESTVRVAKVF